MDKIRVKKLSVNAVIPTYGSADAAGADLYACLDADISIEPGETVFVPTGVAMEIPKGYAGFVYARSSLGSKRGLAPANKVGVIDSDYRGQIMVALHNHGAVEQVLSAGDRIAQLVIAPVYAPGFVEVASLDDTARGEGGFGSTGK